MHGYEQSHDFRPLLRFISEMIQDMAIVRPGMRIANRTQAIEWYHAFSMTLNDPIPNFKVMPVFDAE